MFCVQRNNAEDIHVLVENDHLLGSLDDLNRKQARDGQPRNARRQAQSRWIVYAALVIRLQNFLRGPWLVRRGRVYHLLRPRTRWRRWIATRAADAEPRISFVPTSAARAAALP